MAYIVDIVVVAVLLIYAIRNGKKGFIGCVFGLLVTIISLAVAFFCAETVLELTDGFFSVQSLLTEKITESLSSIQGMEAPLAGEDINAVLEGTKLSPFLIKIIVDSVAVEGAAPGTTLASHIAVTIAEFSTLVITGIVLFLLCKIILTFIEKLFTKAVDSIKFIGFINTFLGALIGAVKGAIAILLVIAVVSIVPNEAITDFFDSTLFVGYFFHNNPINMLFAWIFGV